MPVATSISSEIPIESSSLFIFCGKEDMILIFTRSHVHYGGEACHGTFYFSSPPSPPPHEDGGFLKKEFFISSSIKLKIIGPFRHFFLKVLTNNPLPCTSCRAEGDIMGDHTP